jgi:uncharacterized membrane protein YqaE (UPF0057 family)
MLYLVAVILPPLAVLLCGKPFQALFSLIAQATIMTGLPFGWLLAALHALFVVNNHYADKRTKRLIKATERAAAEERKRVIGREGQARTPFADAAVTTRSPNSSAG